MEVATSDKGMPQGNVFHSVQGIINRRRWGAPTFAGRTGGESIACPDNLHHWFSFVRPVVCCLCGSVSLVIEECLSVEMAVMHDCGVFGRYSSFVDRRVGLVSADSQAIGFS